MLNIQLPYMEYVSPSVEEAFRDLINQLNEAFPDGITSTDLLNSAHWVNENKTHGIMVTTTDTNVTVWSKGNGKTDPWVDASGVNVYVPV